MKRDASLIGSALSRRGSSAARPVLRVVAPTHEGGRGVASSCRRGRSFVIYMIFRIQKEITGQKHMIFHIESSE